MVTDKFVGLDGDEVEDDVERAGCFWDSRGLSESLFNGADEEVIVESDDDDDDDADDDEEDGLVADLEGDEELDREKTEEKEGNPNLGEARGEGEGFVIDPIVACSIQ